jgi:Secretion system C-terminal sorting domain
MYKYLIVFLGLILFQEDIKAQPFGANNATWHYSLYNYFSPPLSISPIKVTSSPAFIFNGYTCRNIYVNHNSGCMSDSNYIVRESNDSVYYYLPSSNQFVMLYNYNAAIGDTQTIYGMDISGFDTSVQMVVTSIGTTTINGSLKRTYDITYAATSHYFDFEGTVIEDVGNTFFLFPQWGFCDPIIHEFRCYEDNVIGLYQVYSNLPCDSIIWLTSNEYEYNDNFLIAPNPFDSEFSITINNNSYKNVTISLYDILGQIKINSQETIKGDSYTKAIEMDSFPKGIYLIVIEIDGQRYVKKIVKE